MKYCSLFKMAYYYLFVLLALVNNIRSQEEIFLNPGFEEPFDGDDWTCLSCDLIRDPNAYSGSYCGRTSNRQADWSTVGQVVPLQSNSYYYFSIHMKLYNMVEGEMWHSVQIQIEVTLEGGEKEYVWVARLPHLRMDQGWEKIGGDFYIGDKAVSSFRAFIQPLTDEYIDYLVDDASLTQFYANPNWKEEANLRISSIRKNDVTLNVNIGEGLIPENMEIQVNQVSQTFPFGSAVVHTQLAGDSEYNQLYQDTYYNNFNWAVLESALKWKFMEPEMDEFKFPDESIRRLNERGYPVRGHCVFWGVEEQVPYWLKTLTPTEIEEQIQKRIDYVVTRYDGQLVHWDVNNEQEHGTWFEEALSEPTLMNIMFTDVRARDEDVLLFLNDYTIVSGGAYTQSLINKAFEVDGATGEVGGIGAQSHFSGYPDITSIQKRLETVRSSGLSLWITELDVEIYDREQRANAYDDLLTLYYAEPAVDGIFLWGFSDRHHWKPNASLFEGEEFVPNAAGLRWQEMMFQRWRTYEIFYPQSSTEIFGFRGFHGFYKILVSYDGNVVLEQDLVLPQGQDITVDLDLNMPDFDI